MKIILFSSIIGIFLNGCLIVGSNTGYCENCGYRDDGFCGNPRDIYKNRYFIAKLSEEGIHNQDIVNYLNEKKKKEK